MKINGIRFIIGSACNFDCFYCHHEGCTMKDKPFKKDDYTNKIKSLQTFCFNNNIHDISITGGEPFLYPEKLKILLEHFAQKPFKLVINSNGSLINKHIPLIKKLNTIEFHINLSSLNNSTHSKIINKSLLNETFQSLEELKKLQHIVKLNIICLKTINDNELIDLHNYAIKNKMEARYLVFYDSKDKYSSLIMTEQEICKLFNTVIVKRHSYGLIETKDNIQIVKCLCIDKQCEDCELNTYMHINPDLTINYCLKKDDSISVDYSNQNNITLSFETAITKQKEICKNECCI